jgi:hypothetical protein
MLLANYFAIGPNDVRDLRVLWSETGGISVSAVVKCYGLPRTWPIIYCYWQLHLLSSDVRKHHQNSTVKQNNIHPDPQ